MTASKLTKPAAANNSQLGQTVAGSGASWRGVAALGSVEKIGVALAAGAALAPGGSAAGVAAELAAGRLRVGTALRCAAGRRFGLGTGVPVADAPMAGVDTGCAGSGVGVATGRGARRGWVITGLSESTGPCTRGGGAWVGRAEGKRKSLAA